MRYLLDTNTCIDYLTGRFPSVVERLKSLAPDEVGVSSVVVAELRYGAEKSARPSENNSLLDRFFEDVPVIGFDARAAGAYGTLRSRLERRGTPIGPNDMLIAAQALAVRSVLVTDNVSEFGRVQGLTIENWRESSV